mmetsp:Transcript_54622/g.151549  ORF Transcript_54622/g.151549 Transcript_54622/m.151549 type:complete len:214 (+) Transcript_54622:2-643(+)
MASQTPSTPAALHCTGCCQSQGQGPDHGQGQSQGQSQSQGQACGPQGRAAASELGSQLVPGLCGGEPHAGEGHGSEDYVHAGEQLFKGRRPGPRWRGAVSQRAPLRPRLRQRKGGSREWPGAAPQARRALQAARPLGLSGRGGRAAGGPQGRPRDQRHRTGNGDALAPHARRRGQSGSHCAARALPHRGGAGDTRDRAALLGHAAGDHLRAKV